MTAQCACVCVCSVPPFILIRQIVRFSVPLSPWGQYERLGSEWTSLGVWNLLSGLYGNTASTDKHKHIRTLSCKQTLTYTERTTKGACGENLSHTHTHTDEVKTAFNTWWVFDHQLSSISLSGCSVSRVLSSASPINPQNHLTSRVALCHFACVCLQIYNVSFSDWMPWYLRRQKQWRT